MGNEDKMREEQGIWEYVDGDMAAHANTITYHEEAYKAGIKACAAIKDAEIAEINSILDEELEKAANDLKLLTDAQAEIAARDLMIKELRGVIQQMLDAQRLSTKYAPDNVEEAEKQLGRIKKAGTAAREALAKSEHHNSRALEKYRITHELVVLLLAASACRPYGEEFQGMITEREAKLAELNKEE